MKRFALFSVCFLLAGILHAGEKTPSAEMLLAGDRGLTLAREGTVLLADDFTKPSPVWKTIMNNENLVRYNYTPQGVDLTNKKGKKGDTAWAFHSGPIPLPAGVDAFTLLFRFRTQINTNILTGSTTYSTRLCWYGKDGTLLDKEGSKLFFDSRNDLIHTATYSGIIPKKAAAVELRLGSDGPNILPGEHFLWNRVQLMVFNGLKARTAKKGIYLSAPVAAGKGKLSWEAEVPAGCSVAFQAAAVPEKGDYVFRGADGKPGTFFLKPAPLPAELASAKKIVLKAILTGNGTDSPLLKSIRAGKVTLRNFKFKEKVNDTNTLEVVRLTPSPSPDFSAPLRFRITDDVEPDWKSLRITLDDTDITKALKRTGNEISYTPASGKFTEGVHECQIRILDRVGKERGFSRAFYRGKMDVPAAQRVTLRDDGMVLVGGKPYFPIGVYAVWKREFNNFDFDKAFKDLKDAGFNFAHTYNGINGPDGELFVRTAEKYGFRLFVGTDRRLRGGQGGLFNVAKWARSPAILAWYTGDDTAMHYTVEEMTNRDQNIKDIDPYRLTCQADGAGGYANYVPCTDAFLPEIYPIKDTPSATKRCVGRVIQDMKRFYADVVRENAARAKRGEKPLVRSCWAIIQHFKGWGWGRFPTEQELRAMSYASIACGAHGITWYTYGGYHNPRTGKTNYGITSSPQVWKEITTITKELNRLQDVLSSRAVPLPAMVRQSGPEKDAMGNASITAIAKAYQGKIYVIAVNSTVEEVKTLWKTGKKPVTDWFTGKTLPSAAEGTPITFKPQDVHIFTYSK